jgi:hypothetical protein
MDALTRRTFLTFLSRGAAVAVVAPVAVPLLKAVVTEPPPPFRLAPIFKAAGFTEVIHNSCVMQFRPAGALGPSFYEAVAEQYATAIALEEDRVLLGGWVEGRAHGA